MNLYHFTPQINKKCHEQFIKPEETSGRISRLHLPLLNIPEDLLWASLRIFLFAQRLSPQVNRLLKEGESVSRHQGIL